MFVLRMKLAEETKKRKMREKISTICRGGAATQPDSGVDMIEYRNPGAGSTSSHPCLFFGGR